MGSETNGLGLGEFVLSHECDEPGGTVVRTMRKGDYSFDTLKLIWEKVQEFDTLFDDFYEKDFAK
jgi:hypothetical protein